VGKVALKHHLKQIPDNATLIIDAARADFIDPDVRELIDKFIADAPDRGIHVECRQLDNVARVRPAHQSRMTFFKRVLR